MLVQKTINQVIPEDTTSSRNKGVLIWQMINKTKNFLRFTRQLNFINIKVTFIIHCSSMFC